MNEIIAALDREFHGNPDITAEAVRVVQGQSWQKYAEEFGWSTLDAVRHTVISRLHREECLIAQGVQPGVEESDSSSSKAA